ncbi:recombinase RecB [Calothrix sp. HK-06]|nr:recombinase RecB [Calothrix sp. HK-06]
MLAGAALRKTCTGHEFSSEYALEEFVWNNLEQLFQLKPVARQHPAKGEFCDILAVNNKQLSILELKNTEDRYVVQQLTRYYDNLLDTKPFAQLIDYNLPVKLIALAPTFHRHNYIDCKHCKLDIDFVQITVVEKSQDFYLHLIDVDTNVSTEIQIPYQKLDINSTCSNIEAPSQLLLDWLGAVPGDEQIAILKMREKILSFDARVTEEIEAKKTIRYQGKGKSIVELCFYRQLNKPIVFMWLPTPSSLLFEGRKQVISRMRLWVMDGNVTHAGHISEGFGRMKLESEWNAMPREKRPLRLFHSCSHKSFSPVRINSFYSKLAYNPASLESLADVALQNWLARI